MKSSLDCKDCLKNLHCDIINKIEELKDNSIQITLLDNKDTVRNRLEELENKMIKCLRKRIYLHNRFPKYILFRDSKYVHSDDEYYLYKYCNKEREYLLNWYYTKKIEEEFGG